MVQECEIVELFGVRYYVRYVEYGYPFDDTVPKEINLVRIKDG